MKLDICAGLCYNGACLGGPVQHTCSSILRNQIAFPRDSTGKATDLGLCHYF